MREDEEQMKYTDGNRSAFYLPYPAPTPPPHNTPHSAPLPQVLNLAALVTELLYNYFPHSIDVLPPDRGIYAGHRPIFFQSTTSADLNLLLHGNQRETSRIEFGAHQVILVRNAEAKERLPPELKVHPCILTVHQSKGLEFDDVLLFNFFSESLAEDEWRVLAAYKDEKMSADFNVGGDGGEQKSPAPPAATATKVRARPLTFDPEQHKVLMSELKVNP